MSKSNTLGTALITGASSGIGATYADRLAKRGYDLILVARNAQRLEALAARLRSQTGVTVRVQRADLTDRADLKAVEQILRQDASITLLINNAGAATPGGFSALDLDAQERIVELNVTAVLRLAGAVIPAFLARGSGAIINIASVLAYGPEIMAGVYPATKAFVAAFSQGLQAELGGRGVYVQAVLPAATRTEIWDQVGVSVDSLPKGTVMAVDDLVDAALVGFDRRELITLPSLPDEGLYAAFNDARWAMMKTVSVDRPAARYGVRASVLV
jgi:short-subunit dehydrogenase